MIQDFYSVAMFPNTWNKQASSITLEEFITLVRSGKWQIPVEGYHRCIADGRPHDAQTIKSSMACIVPAGVCHGGHAKKNLVSLSGILCIDIDHCDERTDAVFASACLLPYIIGAFVSISGKGVKLMVRVEITDVRNYAAIYMATANLISQELGVECDGQCKDITHLCYGSYDPNAYYNPNATAVNEFLPQTPVASDETRASAKPRKAKQHSATASKAETAVLAKLEEDNKQYVDGHRNEFVSSALYLMNRYGVSESEAFEWAQEKFSDYEAGKLAAIVRSVYTHTESHGTAKLPTDKRSSKSEYASLHEVEEYISSQAELRHNVISNRREIRMNNDTEFRDITDRDENSLWRRAVKAGVNCGPKIVQLVLDSEFVPRYNLFHSYFDSLEPWDGTDYIEQLADTVHTNNQPLFHTCLKKWLVAAVGSMLDDSVVNHAILVLIGEQGSYKTTWMNRLLPPELSRYFYTKTNSSHLTKDDLLALSEYGMICLEEIDHLRPSEMNQLKAMTTMNATNERAAYARNRAFRPRVASICGSGNNIHFLNDPTGTRRWLAFLVLFIVNPHNTTLPYRQIYAQAKALFLSNFCYWFDDEDIALLARHNEHFEMPCMEQELIQMHYRKPTPGEHGVFVSTAEIMQRINALIKTPLSVCMVGTVMRKLNFENCRNNKVRGYRVVELTPEEITTAKQRFDPPAEPALPF